MRERWIRGPAMASVLLGAAALLSSGFVVESIRVRRPGARKSLWASLARAMDEAADEAWRAPRAKWRSASERRRHRGQGYGRSADKGPAQEHYDFSDDGKGVLQTLSSDVIRATLRHHDQRIGGCLLRFGAQGVQIQFEVRSDGRLQAIRLDLTGPAEQCVRSVLEGVRFPSRPGGPVKGAYQLRMQ